jgi:hypothetical protein
MDMAMVWTKVVKSVGVWFSEQEMVTKKKEAIELSLKSTVVQY